MSLVYLDIYPDVGFSNGNLFLILIFLNKYFYISNIYLLYLKYRWLIRF